MVTTALRIPDDLQANAAAALRLERARSLQPCNLTDTEICPPSKFRQPTGECNNVSHRKWGARGDVLLRLIAPDYADGISQPRTSHGTHALPDADTVIEQLQNHVDAELRHPHITAMLPAWGQLLANDMYEVSQLTTSPKCCNENVNVKNVEELQQCYVRRGADCKEYKRSAPGFDADTCNKRKLFIIVCKNCLLNCVFFGFSGQREQINVASGYIDGSGLYGATMKDMQDLRTYISGGVKVESCKYCQLNSASGALHRALLQEHNNIGEQLAHLNPDWSEEDVFFEARRIVTAQIQHISYSEFLPIVLGQETTAKEGLKWVVTYKFPYLSITNGFSFQCRLTAEKHSSNYSSTNRAGVYNEVANGAFPSFLTMYPPEMVSMPRVILIYVP